MSDRLSRAREQVEALRRSKPGAAELAMLVSLAVRIEPELLRALRLLVAPHLDVGTEADLWFSPIVQARGVDGITFSAEVAEALREHLRMDARLPRAWHVIEECHTTISPALHLEEKVAWLALSGSPAMDVEEALAPALVALVKEERTGLAPWAARALPRLPSTARSTRVAWVLSLMASRNLAGRMILEDGAPPDLLDEDLTGLLPDLREIDLGVRRTGSKLEVGELRGDGLSMIRVAETVPRLVEIRWEDEEGERRKIRSFRPGSLVEEEVGWGTVSLRTLTGAVYELPAQERGAARNSEDKGEIQDYDEFSIRFQLAAGEGYLVSVDSSPIGEAQIRFHFSSELHQLLDVWGGSEQVRGSNIAKMREMGIQIWNSIFIGEIGSIFEKSLEAAERRARGLRVRVRLGGEIPSGFVPWELLYSEKSQEFLSLSQRTPVVRSLILSDPVRNLAPIPSSEPLRILVATASSRDISVLDLERESRRIETSLARMPDTEVTLLAGATLPALREMLRTERFHIFHFAGHGSADGLFFEDQAGHSDLVSGAVLAELLQNSSLRLVFFNTSSSAGLPNGVAEALAKAGLPAVLGMQRPIPDAAAITFSEAFYRAVAAGRPVDSAVTEARFALLRTSPQDTSWAAPVLFLNTADGNLFERVEVSTASVLQEHHPPFNPIHVSTAGWAIIFSPDVGEEVRKALRPLLEWRHEQAGSLFQVLEYLPGQTAEGFLRSRGVEPERVEPKNVPYYLLLVGDPRTIPFEFQYDLDMHYAVGRLWFDRLEEYESYAQSILRAESGATIRPRQVTFFGVENQDDRATQRTSQDLVVPIARKLMEGRKDWDVKILLGPQATKEELSGLLAGHETPALLFIASHGLSFPLDDPRQLSAQGAVICQDWPGPERWQGEILREHYFSADDLEEEVDLSGLITFQFLCFGGGTPEYDSFMSRDNLRDNLRRLAPHPFVARLPQGLLRRGALAAISHSDRAWTTSFHWGEKSETVLFENMLQRLLDGAPVGWAMDLFGQRYAELANELTRLLDDQASGGGVSRQEVERLRLATQDARSFVVFGDPAVRLSFGEG